MKRVRTKERGKICSRSTLLELAQSDLSVYGDDVLEDLLKSIQTEVDRRIQYTLIYWPYGSKACDGVAIKLDLPETSPKRQWIGYLEDYLDHNEENLNVQLPRHNIAKSEIDRVAARYENSWINGDPYIFSLSDFPDPGAYPTNLERTTFFTEDLGLIVC